MLSEQLLTMEDLRTVTEAVMRTVRNVDKRAKELSQFLRNLYGRNDHHEIGGGREWIFDTPTGKQFVLHEWWNTGSNVPHEIKVWFNTGPTFSFLIDGMDDPYVRVEPKEIRDRRRSAARPDEHATLDSRPNIVACNLDSDTVLLQLAVYAARDRQLSRTAEGCAFDCFDDKFNSSVSWRRNPECLPRLQLSRHVLGDSWERLKKSFSLPSHPNEFEHYVRSTIKYSSYSKDYIATADLDEPTPRQAARFAGLSESTIYALIHRKIIPSKEQGGCINLCKGWYEAVCFWKQRERLRLKRAEDNKLFAVAWSIKRAISLASAMTQIKRWRAKGFAETAIENKLGRDWIKKAREIKRF